MTTTETNPRDYRPLCGTGDLAEFLGGSESSFTGQLLLLLQKADPGNVARIRMGFPEIVEAWEMWNAMSPTPTWRQLQAALDEEAYATAKAENDFASDLPEREA